MLQSAYHCQLKQPQVTQNKSYLPGFIQVLEPQVMRSNCLGQGPKVIARCQCCCGRARRQSCG